MKKKKKEKIFVHRKRRERKNRKIRIDTASSEVVMREIDGVTRKREKKITLHDLLRSML